MDCMYWDGWIPGDNKPTNDRETNNLHTLEDSLVSHYLASCSAVFPDAFFTSSLMVGIDKIITAACENPANALFNVKTVIFLGTIY